MQLNGGAVAQCRFHLARSYAWPVGSVLANPPAQAVECHRSHGVFLPPVHEPNFDGVTPGLLNSAQERVWRL